jgi:hypothetical protein
MRVRETNGFLAFDREYRARAEAEETAKTKQVEADRTAKQRKVQVRRELLLSRSSEFETAHQYKGNLTADQITAACVNAWREFRGNWSPTADVSEEFLRQFMNANLQADITKSSTWTAGVRFIESKLRECETPIETPHKQGVTYKEGATLVDGTRELVPVEPEQAAVPESAPAQERNPYIWGTKAYSKFEKQRRARNQNARVTAYRAERERMLGREPVAEVPKTSEEQRQQAITEITNEVATFVSNAIDRAEVLVENGYELSESARQTLTEKCVNYVNRHGLNALDAARVRQIAIGEWPLQVDMTTLEKRDFEFRTDDSESADAYLRRIRAAGRV